MSKYDFYGDPKRNAGQKYVVLDASDEDNPFLICDKNGKTIILNYCKDLEKKIEKLTEEHNCSYSIIIDLF